MRMSLMNEEANEENNDHAWHEWILRIFQDLIMSYDAVVAII